MSKLILFGNNNQGQCGLVQPTDLSPPDHRTGPHILSLEQEIQSVVCSFDHTLVLTESGQVYSFGCNKNGQLGYQNSHESTSTPTIVKSLTKHNIKIVSIFGGEYYSLALTDKGQVYAWGSCNFGQLGIIGGWLQQPKPEVSALGGIKIKKVSCGKAHTALLTTNGNLLMCGDNEYGQLGIYEDKVTIPTEVYIPGKVKEVACGWDHTAVITEHYGRYELYTCGKNDHGQLGMGDSKDRDTFNQVQRGLFWCKHEGSVTPTNVVMFDNTNFEMVSCGMSHTAVLDTKGNVFITGGNKEGQAICECYDSKDIWHFHYVSPLTPSKYICCGSRSTLVIDRNNNIWVSGANDNGQLGLKDASGKIYPRDKVHLTQLRFDRELNLNKMLPVMISSGLFHTAVLFKEDI